MRSSVEVALIEKLKDSMMAKARAAVLRELQRRAKVAASREKARATKEANKASFADVEVVLLGPASRKGP